MAIRDIDQKELTHTISPHISWPLVAWLPNHCHRKENCYMGAAGTYHLIHFFGAPPAAEKPALLWLREAMRLTCVCQKWQLPSGRNRWNRNCSMYLQLSQPGRHAWMCTYSTHTGMHVQHHSTKTCTKTNMPHIHLYASTGTSRGTENRLYTHTHTHTHTHTQ